MWTNKKNGKRYIGKCHGNVDKRRKDHIRGNGNRLLKHAFDKYGVDNFDFEILHDGVFDELLDDYEIEAISKHKSLSPNGYNLQNGGGAGKWSDEARQKMSEYAKNRTPEHRRNLSESQKGRIVSPEARRKMSETRKGKPSGTKGMKWSNEARQRHSERLKGNTNKRGKKLSMESRNRISEVQKGRKQSPEQIEKRSNSRREWYAKQRLPYKEFFFSLPPDMSITEKRKRVTEFSGKDAKTVWRWCKKWQSE